MIKNKILLRKDIGGFLREARIRKSLTGFQLGKMLHISQQQISRYERGETSINIETLNTLLNILGQSWLDFFSKVMSKHTKGFYEMEM